MTKKKSLDHDPLEMTHFEVREPIRQREAGMSGGRREGQPMTDGELEQYLISSRQTHEQTKDMVLTGHMPPAPVSMDKIKTAVLPFHKAIATLLGRAEDRSRLADLSSSGIGLHNLVLGMEKAYTAMHQHVEEQRLTLKQPAQRTMGRAIERAEQSALQEIAREVRDTIAHIAAQFGEYNSLTRASEKAVRELNVLLPAEARSR